MNERPIIFSGPMVRAILAGRKTQTRRKLRIQPTHYLPEFPPHYDKPTGGAMWGGARGDCGIACPYGLPGDRLWVRETHAGDNLCGWVYRADHPTADISAGELDDGEQSLRRWTPAIHMKREACRLVLEVTDVRVERLWEISADDAFAEGIDSMRCPECHLMAYGLPEWGHTDLQPTPIEAYFHLWDQINEARGYGRSKDPWAWVVSFRRVNG